MKDDGAKKSKHGKHKEKSRKRKSEALNSQDDLATADAQDPESRSVLDASWCAALLCSMFGGLVLPPGANVTVFGVHRTKIDSSL